MVRRRGVHTQGSWVPASFCIPAIKFTLGKSVKENSGAEAGFVAGLELQRWPGGGLPPCPGPCGGLVFNPRGGRRLLGSAHRLPVGSLSLGVLQKLHVQVSEEQGSCHPSPEQDPGGTGSGVSQPVKASGALCWHSASQDSLGDGASVSFLLLCQQHCQDRGSKQMFVFQRRTGYLGCV